MCALYNQQVHHVQRVCVVKDPVVQKGTKAMRKEDIYGTVPKTAKGIPAFLLQRI